MADEKNVFNPYEVGLRRWLESEASIEHFSENNGNLLLKSAKYRELLRGSQGVGETPLITHLERRDRERLLHLRLFHAGRSLGRLEKKVMATVRQNSQKVA